MKLVTVCRSPSLRHGPLYTVEPFQTSSQWTWSPAFLVWADWLYNQLTLAYGAYWLLIYDGNHIAAAYSTLLKFLVCKYTLASSLLGCVSDWSFWNEIAKGKLCLKVCLCAVTMQRMKEKHISKKLCDENNWKMTFWRLLQCTWSGGEKIKRGGKKKRKADHTRGQRQQQSLEKDERKKRIKNHMTDRVGDGNYIHLYVHCTGCNHAASFTWTWDGRRRRTSVLLPSVMHTVWNSQCAVFTSTPFNASAVRVPPLDQSLKWQNETVQSEAGWADLGGKSERDLSVLGRAAREETRSLKQFLSALQSKSSITSNRSSNREAHHLRECLHIIDGCLQKTVCCTNQQQAPWSFPSNVYLTWWPVAVKPLEMMSGKIKNMDDFRTGLQSVAWCLICDDFS